jgi:multidrug efflux pump subunit AcrA (membrane-fusion protein)
MTRKRDQQRLRLRAATPFASFLVYVFVGAVASPAAAQQTPTASPSDRKEGPAQMRLVVPGTVQAFYATDLYAKDSGYVSQIHADIGDRVKKNQVLAVIDDPELQQQLLRSRAAVQQAAASLEVAKRRLTGLQADRALQQVTLKRSEQLFAGKAVATRRAASQGGRVSRERWRRRGRGRVGRGQSAGRKCRSATASGLG